MTDKLWIKKQLLYYDIYNKNEGYMFAMKFF